jgi:hypothetical protein
MKPTEGPNAVRLRSTVKVSENGRRSAELACPDPVSVEAIGLLSLVKAMIVAAVIQHSEPPDT